MKAKQIFIDIAAYLFIFLFLYTAHAKFVDMEKFTNTLAHSQMIGKQLAPLIARLIPTTEALIGLFLIIPITRKVALKYATGLMVVFTTYLIIMLASGLPRTCNCGGVIEAMSWPQHIFFNLFFIALGVFAVYFDNIIRLLKHIKPNQRKNRFGNTNQPIINH